MLKDWHDGWYPFLAVRVSSFCYQRPFKLLPTEMTPPCSLQEHVGLCMGSLVCCLDCTEVELTASLFSSDVGSFALLLAFGPLLATLDHVTYFGFLLLILRWLLLFLRWVVPPCLFSPKVSSHLKIPPLPLLKPFRLPWPWPMAISPWLRPLQVSAVLWIPLAVRVTRALGPQSRHWPLDLVLRHYLSLWFLTVIGCLFWFLCRSLPNVVINITVFYRFWFLLPFVLSLLF